MSIPSESDPQRILSSLPGAPYTFLIRVDGTSSFPYIAPQCEALVGIPAAKLNASALHVIGLIEPVDAERFQHAVTHSMESMEPFSWAGRMNIPGQGIKMIRAESTPTAHPEGVLWYGFMFEAVAEFEIQRQLLDAQHTMLNLSAPIIEVWDGIVTVPLQGSYDDRRANHLTEALLNKISQQGIQLAILDLTGITDIDTTTIQHLLRVTQAVRLLGARCLLSGISSEVAQTIVELGLAFGNLKTYRTLQQALKDAIGAKGKAQAQRQHR